MRMSAIGLSQEEVISKTKKYMMEFTDRLEFACDHAGGMYMYDAEGNAYLDFFAGIGVNGTGSCNERVVTAICDQAKDLIHASAYIYTAPQALLAEKICTTIGMDRIFFQNSGTEANEAMIKLARKYGIDTRGANDWKIVTAYQSFHGRTFGSMAATGQPDNACQLGFGPMMDGFRYAEFNNLESFRNAVDDDTVAIMVEPVQGEGGVYPAAQEFLAGLRELCDEKGLLLLFDEVQTGWCRTGSVMAYMGYGVKPDAVTMAKALGGGMPIGALCATEEVASHFTPGSHGSTFGGNALACTAALAEIDELMSKDLAANARETGAYLMKRLEDLPYIKEVRGRGLMVGAEFKEPVKSAALKHKCFENGLLVTAIGENIIRLLPPLIATKKDCDNAVEIMYKSVLETADEA